MTNNLALLPYILIYLLVLIFPFFLAAWLIKRSKTGWKIFWIGILACIVAGIAHLASLYGLSLVVKPVDWGVSPSLTWILFSITTGLLSAIFVEGLRWLGFRWANNQKAQSAWVMAAGSGGIVIIGNMLLAIFLMLFLIVLACSKAAGGPPIYLPIVNYNMQVNCSGTAQAVQPSTLQTTWAYLLALLSSLYPITLHLATSLLVWMAVQQRKTSRLSLAIAWHMLNVGISVYLSGSSLFPWTTQSTNLPTLITSNGIYGLMALNLVFVSWLAKRAKAIEPSDEISLPETSQEVQEPEILASEDLHDN
jgi:uncharacterized membrane protein YhfC